MDRADGVGSLTVSEPDHPAWTRLVDQLAWYDRKSVPAQRAFKRLKVIEVVLAAAIPVVAGLRWPPRVTDPRSCPCRTAARCGLCLLFGPASAVTSASISA